MRTLHADLTAAQQSASRTPYVRLLFRSRDRSVSRTYTTADATNRILAVTQAEARLDELDLEVAGVGLPISAVIRLNDYDQTLGSLDWDGYRVDVGWGFNTDSGDRYIGDGSSEPGGPPLFVVESRSVSREGELTLELYCMSLWDLLKASTQYQDVGDRIEYQADVSVRHILMELLAGGKPEEPSDPALPILGTVVQKDAAGVYENFAAEAVNPTTGGDLGADDVELVPDAGDTGAGAAVFFGLSAPFDTVTIDLTTPGSGTWAVAWEYWNGTGWSALSNVSDSLNAFRQGELKTTTFDRPASWPTLNARTAGPTNAAFPNTALYYVRARVSSYTSKTTVPVATKIMLGLDLGLTLDTASGGDDFKPQYSSDYRKDLASHAQDVMGQTLLGVVTRPDGFHLVLADDDVSSIDYTYDTAHAFHVGVLKSAPVFPNKVTVTNLLPGDSSGTSRVSGSDTHTDSETAFGTVERIVVEPAATSAAECTTLAERAIKRLVRDTTQGEVTVPMNVAQEVWDVIRVIDSRSNQDYVSRVSAIVRTYSPGEYRMQIRMGGHVLSQPVLPTDQFAEAPSPVGVSRKDYLEYASRGKAALAFEPYEESWPGVQEPAQYSALIRPPSWHDTRHAAAAYHAPPGEVPGRDYPIGSRSLRRPYNAPPGEVPGRDYRIPAPTFFTEPAFGGTLPGGFAFPAVLSTYPDSVLSQRSRDLKHALETYPRIIGARALGGTFYSGALVRPGYEPTQVETSPPTGKWTASDGSVIFDSSGITVIGDLAGTVHLTFKYGSVTVGNLRNVAGNLYLTTAAGHLFLDPAAGYSVRPAGSKIFGSLDTPWLQVFTQEVRFVEDAPSGNYVAFSAPSLITADTTWTLPAVDGSNGQVMKTNGSGTLSWTTVLANPATAALDMNNYNITNIYASYHDYVYVDSLSVDDLYERTLDHDIQVWNDLDLKANDIKGCGAIYVDDVWGGASGEITVNNDTTFTASSMIVQINDSDTATEAGANSLQLTRSALTGAGRLDSPFLVLRGRSHDGATQRQPQLRLFIDVTANDGTATAYFRLDTDIAGNTDMLSFSTSGDVGFHQDLDMNTQQITGVTTVSIADYVELDEASNPPGATDKARLYSRDNGSGKTQLCVQFPTGAVQVLATEP